MSQPAYAIPAEHLRHHPSLHRPALTVSDQLALFSPRVRRSTVTYLRLRLLELREQDLDRARAAIERRLSIEDLLAGPSSAARSH